jgi:hydrogenase maturation protease
MSAGSQCLVLGIGNILMSDDGVGSMIVSEMSDTIPFPDEVTLLDGGTLGLDLLQHLEGVSKLVVVDAVNIGAVPGTLVRLVGDEVQFALSTKVSPHQIGFKDLLAVADLMGNKPVETVLLGVQPENLEIGIELSPSVAASYKELKEMVLKEVGLNADD